MIKNLTLAALAALATLAVANPQMETKSSMMSMSTNPTWSDLKENIWMQAKELPAGERYDLEVAYQRMPIQLQTALFNGLYKGRMQAFDSRTEYVNTWRAKDMMAWQSTPAEVSGERAMKLWGTTGDKDISYTDAARILSTDANDTETGVINNFFLGEENERLKDIVVHLIKGNLQVADTSKIYPSTIMPAVRIEPIVWPINPYAPVNPIAPQ
jgi:hypothetical protein